MASKRLYCRILDYLEKDHPQLATIFHNLCAEGFLSPRRKPGVTLLIPEDKKIIDSLLADSSSGDLDKMNKALEHIGELVIPFNLPAASSLTGDMSNSLGFSLEATVSGDTIKFSNNATAKKDSTFAQFKKDPFLHVYRLSGAIPSSTKKADTKEILKKQLQEKKKVKESLNKKAKSGGNDLSYDGAFDLGTITTNDEIQRAGLVIRAENAAAAEGSTAPLISLAVNLLDLIKEKDQKLCCEICCLLTGREVDLYILIEPFRHRENKHKYVVSQEYIKELDQKHAAGSLPTKNQAALLEYSKMAKKECLSLHSQINKIREEITSNFRLDNIKEVLDNAYKNFYQGTFKSTLGAESHLGKIYGDDDGWKMKKLDDEFRFRGCILLETMQQSNQHFDETFEQFRNLAADIMSGVSIFNKSSNESIFDNANIMITKCFFNSSAFLFIALPNNQALDVKNRSEFGKIGRSLEDVWDIRGATKRTGELKA